MEILVTDPLGDVFREIHPAELADRASATINDLWTEIIRTVLLIRSGKAHWSDVSALLQQIDIVQADLRMAGLTVGLLSPWMSDAVSMASASVELIIASPETIPRDPDGIRKLLGTLPESERQELMRWMETRRGFDVPQWRSISEVTRYSPATAAYKFPRIEEGVKFLAERNVVTQQQWERMAAAEKVRTVYLPGANQSTVNRLRSALSESFRDGESTQDFRKRIEGVTDASKAEVETLFRTQTKQAYLDGVTTLLESPKVGSKFPAVLYQATRDNRTRPLHAAWDGKIIGIDTPEYATAKALQAEYNCRCTLIPLTERRAKQMGWTGGSSQPEQPKTVVAKPEPKTPAKPKPEPVGTVTLSGKAKPVTSKVSTSKFGEHYERVKVELKTKDRPVGTLEAVHNSKTGTVEVRASDAMVRSQGVGQMLYRAGINKARELGAEFFSSDQRLSPSAAKAWKTLSKSQSVEVMPHKIEPDGSLVSVSGGPVYRIKIK